MSKSTCNDQKFVRSHDLRVFVKVTICFSWFYWRVPKPRLNNLYSESKASSKFYKITQGWRKSCILLIAMLLNSHAEFHLPEKCQTLVIVNDDL